MTRELEKLSDQVARSWNEGDEVSGVMLLMQQPPLIAATVALAAMRWIAPNEQERFFHCLSARAGAETPVMDMRTW